MYVSQESSEQIHSRLLNVIATSSFKVYDESYIFEEFTFDQFPKKISIDALALIRDDELWSQLIPSSNKEKELFKIFRFHFTPGIDNSGFVGWLANHIKNTVGAGVFVTCGQNSKLGGIYDYWGCPLEVSERVIEEIIKLRSASKNI